METSCSVPWCTVHVENEHGSAHTRPIYTDDAGVTVAVASVGDYPPRVEVRARGRIGLSLDPADATTLAQAIATAARLAVDTRGALRIVGGAGT